MYVKLAAVSALLATAANGYRLPGASSGVGMTLSPPLIQAPVPEQDQPLVQVPELVQPTPAPEQEATHPYVHNEEAAIQYWSERAETAPALPAEEVTVADVVQGDNLPTSMDANGGSAFQSYGSQASTTAQETSTAAYTAPTTVASTTAQPTTTVASATVAPPQRPTYGNQPGLGRRMRPRGRAVKPSTISQDGYAALPRKETTVSDTVKGENLPISAEASGESAFRPYGSQPSTTAAYTASTTEASTTAQPTTTVASETVALPQQPGYGSQQELVRKMKPDGRVFKPHHSRPRDEETMATTTGSASTMTFTTISQDNYVALPTEEITVSDNVESDNLPTSVDATGESGAQSYGSQTSTTAQETSTAAYTAPTTVASTTAQPATTAASETVAPPEQPTYGNQEGLGRRMNPHGRAFKPHHSRPRVEETRATTASSASTVASATISQDGYAAPKNDWNPESVTPTASSVAATTLAPSNY